MIAIQHAKSVTILDTEDLSDAAFTEDFELCGVITPSGWDTAAITFQGSPDNVTFYNIWDGASELAFAAVSASKFVVFDPAKFMGVPYVKVRSGTGASAVAQSGTVVLTLMLRKIINK